MEKGPVRAILDAMYPEGYWVAPGPGYAPKYRGTNWQVVFLARLPANRYVSAETRIAFQGRERPPACTDDTRKDRTTITLKLSPL
jgi:hypothetical protein